MLLEHNTRHTPIVRRILSKNGIREFTQNGIEVDAETKDSRRKTE